MQSVEELAKWMSNVFNCEVSTSYLDELLPVAGSGNQFVLDKSNKRTYRALLVKDQHAIGEMVLNNWSGQARGLELIGETLEILLAARTNGERLEALAHLESKVREGKIVGLPDVSQYFASQLRDEPFRNQAILLMGKNISPDFFRKLALDLHEETGRWAFLNIGDLDSVKTFADSSLAPILELGPISIYIPEISEITIEIQIRLMEYLSINPSENMPRIIAASTLSMRELISGGSALAGLLERFYICTISEEAQKNEAMQKRSVLNLVDYIRDHRGLMLNSKETMSDQIH